MVYNVNKYLQPTQETWIALHTTPTPKQMNINPARRHKINEPLEELGLDRGSSLSVTV